ncbi:hypothetical protein ASPWEDRAFT_215259 [Aspergillus wentii DTO 134E9]|uniref:Uncharacterized protein n=1 Tax=Aspergillus wentii DTO 134E9 TaxID=1073089 RepID=A0A1L9RZS6_ASPWE|nr:uncharacterized protein ASPWEDRAFT_215259 [Aspergillus wentii DTO 134E9]OJJ40440.1 hypothetical protein ASPWEDRAFT_215259 [Aspergillus wentii DTO 134E9]
MVEVKRSNPAMGPAQARALIGRRPLRHSISGSDTPRGPREFHCPDGALFSLTVSGRRMRVARSDFGAFGPCATPLFPVGQLIQSSSGNLWGNGSPPNQERTNRNECSVLYYYAQFPVLHSHSATSKRLVDVLTFRHSIFMGMCTVQQRFLGTGSDVDASIPGFQIGIDIMACQSACCSQITLKSSYHSIQTTNYVSTTRG